MNIDQAAINISGVLQDSRIETPKGPLTSREHQQLAADLHLLISRAKEVDELKKEVEVLNELVDTRGARIRELELIGTESDDT